MNYRLAIDLGTTFSTAAVASGSDPSMVGLGNRSLQLPSVVFVQEDGTFLVGETAERRGLADPGRLAREFKRRLGDHVPMLLGGAAYSAETLMARLLRAIVEMVTVRQGANPDAIICTYPANWGPYKLELFRQVVALADLPPVQLCTEPVAAAAQYSARAALTPGERVAVYDLGGGTFDVCVLQKTTDGFELLGSPDGIEHLGGVDFDEALTAQVLKSVGDRLPELDPDDPSAIRGLARLRRDCVDAKEALSTDTETVVTVALPGLSTAVRIGRRDLEAAIRPALEDTVQAMRRSLRSASVEPSTLKAALLVGGSSRIPLVSELIQRSFGLPVALDAHPKHDIALGAARLCESRTPVDSRVGLTAQETAPPRLPVGGTPDRSVDSDLLEDPDYLDAVSALHAERWSTAIRLLEHVAVAYPRNARVGERLDRARREFRWQELATLAATAEDAGDWTSLAAALEEMLQLKPEHADLDARLQTARRRESATRLAGEITSMFAAEDWSGVVDAASKLSELDLSLVPDPMVEQARYEIETAELNRLYPEAESRLGEGDWTAAISVLERLRSLRAGYRDVEHLLAAARSEQELATLYETATDAESEHRWSEAESTYRRILATDTNYRDTAARLESLEGRVESASATVIATDDASVGTAPMRAKRHRSRPVTLMSVLGLALAIVVVAVVLQIARRQDTPSSDGSLPPSGSESPQTTANASPNPPILAHIPPAYRKTCRVGLSSQGGAQATVLCAPRDGIIDYVNYRQYAGKSAYESAIRGNQQLAADAKSDCSHRDGAAKYRITTVSGIEHSGILSCLIVDSSRYVSLTWTVDDLLVIAEAFGASDVRLGEVKNAWTTHQLE